MIPASRAASSPRLALPPNILWIVTTQWRAQACGYAGDPNAHTPHLDALASQAINYTQTVTPHPFGPFARAAMLTGVPCPQNGVRDYFDPLPAEARTVAQALRERGYLTAWFGKWHLSRRDRRAPLVGEAHARTIVPIEARGGFEFWEGFESGFQLNDPWLHGTRVPEPVQVRGYQSDVLCDRAMAWIRDGERARGAHPPAPVSASAARPWFCVVSLEAPHPPYDAPTPDGPEIDAEALRLAPNVPRGGEIENRARRELAGYYRHIAATDRAIGRLVAHVSRDAIIVFTSVHGDMHGSHGLFRKGWPHEESVRVPLLVRLPPKICEQASTSLDVVSLLDLPAMTLAWSEGRPWRAATDFSVLSMSSVVALRDQCDRAWHAVRTPTAKVVFTSAGAPWLVYDLASDPFEQRNLADEKSGVPMIELARAHAGRAGGPF